MTAAPDRFARVYAVRQASPRAMHAGLVGSAMLICVLFVAAASARAQDQIASTDEAGLSSLLRDMAVQTAGAVGEREIRIRMLPEDVHPMVLQVFAEECALRGVQITGGAAAQLTLDVRSLSASTVSHDKSSYVRRLEAMVGVLAEASDGTVRFTRTFRGERVDTLTGVIPPASRDYRFLHSASWIERALVPIVAATAAVVVAVLLFTVRGS